MGKHRFACTAKKYEIRQQMLIEFVWTVYADSTVLATRKLNRQVKNNEDEVSTTIRKKFRRHSKWLRR